MKTTNNMKQRSPRIISLLAVSFAFLFPSVGQAARNTPVPKSNVSDYKTVAAWVKIDPKLERSRSIWWNSDDPDLESAITFTMQEILLEKGYEPLDRSTSASLAVEVEGGMGTMGVTEGTPEGAAHGAKGAFIATLIAVNRKPSGGTATVGLQLVTIPGRKVLWAGQGSYDSDNLGKRMLKNVGGAVVGGAAKRGAGSGIVGGVGGIIPGNAVTGDRTLADVIQEAVRRAAKNLPSQPS